MQRLQQVTAAEEAYSASRFSEIRFKDGDTKIVRINPTKTDFREEVFEKEGEAPQKSMKYVFTASERIDEGKWTRFKLMKFSPTWGKGIVANIEEGNLTLKITRKGSTMSDTEYIIVTSNAK